MKNKKAPVGTRIIQGLEEFAEALEKGEDVTRKFTCREVQLNLEPTPYSPALVSKTRKLLNASQTVFARFLGVSPNTVRSWEQGVSTPNDVASRFMDEIRRNPAYWIKRLEESTVVKQ